MSKNLRWTFLALLATVSGAGCGTARYLTMTPTGGTLALEGDADKANAVAKRLMSEHCRSGYQVVSEGERQIGTEAERRQETKTSFVCKPAPEKKAARPAAPAADAPAAAAAPDGGVAQ